MIGKDEPGDFDLDIDLDDDFDEDPPSGLGVSAPVEAPPSAPSRPTPRGIGPPPSAPPPPRNRTGSIRYRAPRRGQPPRRPTRIPGVPLTEAETAQVAPADIDPESLSNIFGTDDPMAFGTVLGDDDVPETNLDDGFDPWGDLSDSDGVNSGSPMFGDGPDAGGGAEARRASDTLQTPVVGIRDQLDAEAAVPEFDDLADLGFSARPVTLQQLNLADPSYVEGMSDGPLAEEYVSFDDVGLHETEAGDDAADISFGADDEEPASAPGLKQLALGSTEVETNPLDVRGEDELFDDFSIDVDDRAVSAPNEAATVDLADSSAVLPEPEVASAQDADFGFDTEESKALDDALGAALGFDQAEDEDDDEAIDSTPVAELGDSELDFESALDSREFKRVQLDEAAFDDDGNDSRAAMLFGANEEINTPRVDPVELDVTKPGPAMSDQTNDVDDDELFGDDHDDDIGEIDLHLPEWSPLQGEQATETVGAVIGGIDDLVAQAESLLRRSRLEDASDLLNAALDQDPSHAAAAALRTEVALRTDEMAFEALGEMDGHPKLRIHPNDIVSLQIDSKGAYLLMQIDGELTTADLLELSPMGHAATARLLAQFVRDEVIVIVPPDPWDPRRPR